MVRKTTIRILLLSDIRLWFLQVCFCILQYLQKGVHFPLCLSQNEAVAQGNEIQLEASSHSWTLEVWEPAGESSWLGSKSSSMHNEMLLEGEERQRRQS